VLVFSSCSMLFKTADGNLGYFPNIIGTPVGKFEASQELWFIIDPILFPMSRPHENLDKMIGPEVFARGGAFAKNLEISYGFTIWDFVITYFVPFVGRGTISVSGEAFSNF